MYVSLFRIPLILPPLRFILFTVMVGRLVIRGFPFSFLSYTWPFPLCRKSDVFEILITFHAYVATQFRPRILQFHTDNERVFDKWAFHSFLGSHGILVQLSCPYTSQQNSRTERIICTLIDGMRTLLFHSHAPTRLCQIINNNFIILAGYYNFIINPLLGHLEHLPYL